MTRVPRRPGQPFSLSMIRAMEGGRGALLAAAAYAGLVTVATTTTGEVSAVILGKRSGLLDGSRRACIARTFFCRASGSFANDSCVITNWMSPRAVADLLNMGG